jgi:hypothetical protein
MKGMLSKVVLTEDDDIKKGGYRNIYDIQKQDAPQFSLNKIRGILELGVKQGVLETKKIKVIWNGRLRAVWHWREKKK